MITAEEARELANNSINTHTRNMSRLSSLIEAASKQGHYSIDIKDSGIKWSLALEQELIASGFKLLREVDCLTKHIISEVIEWE
jgi:hypothetical protein